VSVATSAATPPVQASLRPRARAAVLRTVLPVGALAAMIAFFGIRCDTFLTLTNLTVMSGEAAPLLLAALGATFVVVMGSIDLSVGSVTLLTGSVTAWLLANTGAGLLVIPAGLAVGAAAGLANGLVFTVLRVPSFVTTLGSLSILSGVGLMIINGSPLPYDNPGFSDLAIGRLVPDIQNAALWAVGCWAVAVVLAFWTPFGVGAYAIGGGERVARLSGLPIARYKVQAFVLSGMTASLAGILSVGQLGSGGPTLGSNLLLDVLAAIVVGGTALAGGSGGVHRTLLGVLIITVLANGLNQLGVGEFQQDVVKGCVVIAAVAITMLPLRRSEVK